MLPLLHTVRAILDGRKTYIVGILSILLGIVQGDTQLILQGLGFIGLRLAI